MRRSSRPEQITSGQGKDAEKMVDAYPCLCWNDSFCDNLEVVHVEDVLERRAGGPGGLPSLLLCRDLLDHLGNRARVNGTKADSKLSASWKHWLCAYDILFFDWQVSCDGIWWVDGLVRFRGIFACVLEDDFSPSRVVLKAFTSPL